MYGQIHPVWWHLQQVQKFKDSANEGNEGFGLRLKIIDFFMLEKELVAWELGFAKFSLEDSKR